MGGIFTYRQHYSVGLLQMFTLCHNIYLPTCFWFRRFANNIYRPPVQFPVS